MTKSILLKSISRISISRDLGERDTSVDVLRGLAIIGMILVNHEPPATEIYGFLTHAPWVGWTFADTIFPIFLFLVGISISYSGRKQLHGTSTAPHLRIVRRTVLLILINIALVNFPYYEIDKLVFQGTLSTIAICYMAAALLYYHCSWKAQFATVFMLVIVQWWVLTQLEVPEFGRGELTISGNASTYLDNLLFGQFTERLTLNSPISQGILPTAGTVATTIIGALVGQWLMFSKNTISQNRVLFLTGLVLFIIGYVWSDSYPISKILWTGSYVVLMAGLSLQLLGLINWLLRFPKLSVVGMPFLIAGVNALFFYVFAQSFQRILVYGRIEQADGTAIRVRYLIYENWIEPWVGGAAGALIYTLIFLAICYFVVFVLYRWRIFIKL